MIILYFLLYVLVTSIVSVFIFPFFIVALILHKKIRAGVFEKLGIKKFKKLTESILVHAVSVGEVNAAVPLVKKLREHYPNLPIIVTTVTETGQKVAHNKLSSIATVCYFPYDFIIPVWRFLNSLNPKIIIIIETEIWPLFLQLAQLKKSKIYLANGRISPNSYKNYLSFRFFFRYILRNFSKFFMQSDMDAERIKQIGASTHKVITVGNVKFDVEARLKQEEIEHFRESLCIHSEDKVFIAGSTHEGEEELILDIYEELAKEIKNLKLILAPRHPERQNEMLALMGARGLLFGLRSQKNDFKNKNILLLNTVGELASFYAIANVSFVGGSLVNTGGHNILEPIAYNQPVITGPYHHNFLDITKTAVEAGCCFLVQDAQALKYLVKELLTNQEMYHIAQNACKSILAQNRGATNKIIHSIYSDEYTEVG